MADFGTKKLWIAISKAMLSLLVNNNACIATGNSNWYVLLTFCTVLSIIRADIYCAWNSREFLLEAVGHWRLGCRIVLVKMSQLANGVQFMQLISDCDAYNQHLKISGSLVNIQLNPKPNLRHKTWAYL